MSDPILFVLAVVTILATPGPTNTLMATSGATSGISKSLILLAAEITGYLTATLAVHFVLGRVVEIYPAVGTALKVAVAIYLAWLAIKLWRRPLLEARERAVTFGNVYITTLLNPKALIFALTIIPWSAPRLAWYLLGFAVIVIAAGGGWIVLGSVVGATSGGRAGYVPRLASIVLIAFAGIILRAAF